MAWLELETLSFFTYVFYLISFAKVRSSCSVHYLFVTYYTIASKGEWVETVVYVDTGLVMYCKRNVW